MSPQDASSQPDGPVPRIVQLAIDAAEKLGLSARIVDPAYGYLFEISSDDQCRQFVGGLSPLNTAVASRIAQDKLYSEMLLKEAGFGVPGSVRCFRAGYFKHMDDAPTPGLDAANDFAAKRGFPLIVKPNRMALGRDVRRVESAQQLQQAIVNVWEADYIALVQPVIHGADLRLDFVGDEYMVGYMRKPVSVRGDGVQTLRQLLVAIDRRFSQERFWGKRFGDDIWSRVVTAKGYDENSVLPAGQQLHFGGTVLNLNQWATAHRIDKLPAPWLAYCRRIGRTLHLAHFGIDLRVPEMTGAEQLPDVDPNAAVIIEVNASPSLVQIRQLGWEHQAMNGQMLVLRKAFGLD